MSNAPEPMRVRVVKLLFKCTTFFIFGIFLNFAQQAIKVSNGFEPYLIMNILLLENERWPLQEIKAFSWLRIGESFSVMFEHTVVNPKVSVAGSRAWPCGGCGQKIVCDWIGMTSCIRSTNLSNSDGWLKFGYNIIKLIISELNNNTIC